MTLNVEPEIVEWIQNCEFLIIIPIKAIVKKNHRNDLILKFNMKFE